MSTTRITICAKTVRAMLHCTGKKDIRWYINGIIVEPIEGAAALFATDGHVMACQMTTAKYQGHAERINIPRDIVQRIPAAAKELTLTQRGKVVTMRIDGDKRATRESWAKIEDGRFDPLLSARRSAAGVARGYQVAVDAELVGRITKTVCGLVKAKTAGMHRPKPDVRIMTAGESGAFLFTSVSLPDFLGFVMSMRASGVAEIPSWAMPRAEQKDAA